MPPLLSHRGIADTRKPSDSEGPALAELRAASRSAGLLRVATLALSDLAALLVSGTIAFLLWASPVHNQPAALYIPAAPMALAVVVAYGIGGLYPGFGLGPVEAIRRYVLITLSAFVTAAALVLLLKLDNTYSRMTLGIALSLSLMLVPVFRWLALRLLRSRSWWAEPVITISTDGRRLLQNLLTSHPEFRAVAEVRIPARAPAERREDVLAAAVAYRSCGIRTAFVDVAQDNGEALLDDALLLFPRVILLREIGELPVEGVQVRNLGGVLGLEYGSNLLRRESRLVKRTADVILASMLVVILSPVIVGAMLCVKLLSRGPALFWQRREGRRHRPVRIPKIRTMIPDAEKRMEEIFATDPALRAEWESDFKLKRDPRIIPVVGKLFRRFSIDELPQLWSVIKGDMSLVGPRPFPGYHLDALSEHARRLRSEVRPGITGLWQITSRGAAGVEAQQAYDVYYIRNWSPWLDLYILAKTVSVVLTGRGAY